MQGNRRAALAAMAAIAGTGYASGRELVLFFAQLGWASWIGIALASTAFALMTALIVRWAGGAGPDGLPGACRRQGAGRALGLLHSVLMAMAAAVMLLNAGRVGELTLPVEHGFAWGAGMALLLAGLVCLGGLRALPWLGLATFALGAAFHLGLALDPRPVRTWLSGDVELALAGSLPAAALLAIPYAALNACVAGDAVARFAACCPRPSRLGVYCGALMALALVCANAALLRGGRTLLAQALPMVLLSARWGLFGFWLCAGFDWLCAACTLSAALGSMTGPFQR